MYICISIHIYLPKQIVLIGAGGVSSGADAYEKIRAGASLVEVCACGLALERK